MEIGLQAILGGLMLVGIRVSGLMLFAPFLGHAAIPMRIKAATVVLITAALYPAYASRLPALEVSRWPLLVLSELLVGVAMGIATNLVFESAQLAGQILSVQMGYSLVNILDPQTQVDTTVVSVFHQTLVLLIFLQLDVHHWILRGIGKSFDYLPPGAATANLTFVNALLRGVGGLLEIGIQIAAPVLAATLVADLAMGFLGKASPQMPLLLLGPAVKSLLGLTVLGVALKYWPALFEHYFTESVALGERLLHLAH